MDDFTRVKEAVDLVDVVSRYVPLKRAGTRMVGLCPFHAEKSPSFGVQIGQKFFKCFGCGKGGDVFTFIAEVERIEKVEVLHRLADELGIALTGRQGPSRDEKERVLRVLEKAQELYRRAFQSELGGAARELIAGRGLTAETQDAFGIGFAPTGAGRRNVIAQRLVQAGHRREDVVAAGVALERDGDLIDTMRDRVTIPIRDDRGRVVAFGGRRLHDGEEVRDPKYINSRETLVFSKSRVLYGLDRARATILAEERVVLVEGYLDVILAHQAGLTTAVAALGTSVTGEHAKHLARLAPRLILFLDSDTAGQRAAERAVPLLLNERLEVKVLGLRDDKDPGDFFARGATRATFDELLAKQGVGGLDFLLARAGIREVRTVEDRLRVARQLASGISDIADPLARAAASSHVARELDLPVENLVAALRAQPAPRAASASPGAASGSPPLEKPLPTPPGAPPASSAQVIAEEELLIALVHEPALRAVASSALPDGAVVDPVRARLFKGLVAGVSDSSDGALLERFAGDPDAQQTLQDLVHRPLHADPGRLFDGAVRFFERTHRRRQGDEIREGFRQRLHAGDPAAAAEFLRRFESFRKGDDVKT